MTWILISIWLVMGVAIFCGIMKEYYDSRQEPEWKVIIRMFLMSIFWPATVPVTIIALAIHNKGFKP